MPRTEEGRDSPGSAWEWSSASVMPDLLNEIWSEVSSVRMRRRDFIRSVGGSWSIPANTSVSLNIDC